MPENRFYLASAPIWRSLIHLCIPMIAGFSVGVVYNIINAGFVGSLHSTPMLAALTFSMPVFALIMAMGGVFGVGGGTYISRLLGSQENSADPEAAERRIKQVSSFTLWGSLAVGAILGIAGILVASPLAQALGAGGGATAPTAQYIGAMFAFMPILVASFSLEQLVRAEGATMASMVGLVASTVANLVFDVLFILVLHWGVLGAGIALGLSNIVMAGYYVYWLSRRSASVSLSLRWFRVDAEMVKTVFGVGSSELLQSSFLVVSSLVANWVAVGYGAALVASIGVAQRIAQFPEMMCMGVCFGVIPLLAYAFGARNRDRLRRGIAGAAWSIAGITVVFSTAVFVFRGTVVALFSDDPAVLRDGTLVLTAMLVSTLFNGLTGLLIAIFQATEQVRNATIMSVAQGVLFIPVVLIANALFAKTGVIWAMTLTELLMLVVGLLLFRRSRALDIEPSAETAQSATPALIP